MLNTILNIAASIVVIIFLVLVIANIITDGKSDKKINESKPMKSEGFRKAVAAALKFLTKFVKK